jgi:hypothetical protein
MEAIHHLIAYLVVGGVALGIGWSVVLVVTGRAAGRIFEMAQAAVVSIVFVAAASGLLLLITGGWPQDPLHLLYALLAIALIPLARSFLGRDGARRSNLLLLAAFLVLTAVVYRLFTTG